MRRDSCPEVAPPCQVNHFPTHQLLDEPVAPHSFGWFDITVVEFSAKWPNYASVQGAHTRIRNNCKIPAQAGTIKESQVKKIYYIKLTYNTEIIPFYQAYVWFLYHLSYYGVSNWC